MCMQVACRGQRRTSGVCFVPLYLIPVRWVLSLNLVLDQQLAPATLRLHLLIVLGLQKGTTILKFVLKTWMVQIWTQALWLPHESPVATEAISPGLIPLLSEFLFSPQELRLTRCPSGFLWYAGSFGIVRSGPPSPRGSGWSSLSKADSCAQTMPILEGTLASLSAVAL